MIDGTKSTGTNSGLAPFFAQGCSNAIFGLSKKTDARPQNVICNFRTPKIRNNNYRQKMNKILYGLLLITSISCKDNHSKGVEQTLKSTNAGDTIGNESNFYNDNVFFKEDSISYHYKNVKYFSTSLNMSPVYLGGLLVKETREEQGSYDAEGGTTTISLDMMTNEKKLLGGTTFKKECDEARLYSHFIETVTFEPSGGWDNIDLYRYDNFSEPFLKSDEQYWFFSMNSDNQHISKNCFFVTLEKFPDGYACILRLSDMNGLLQEVKIKNSNETTHDIDFMYPQITFKSNNPFQYRCNAAQSKNCNLVSISPKDYSNLRNHLTSSSFKLVFYDKKDVSDSLLIPIENGLLFGKNDKTFDVEIYK